MVKGLNPAAEFPSLYAKRWVGGFEFNRSVFMPNKVNKTFDGAALPSANLIVEFLCLIR